MVTASGAIFLNAITKGYSALPYGIENKNAKWPKKNPKFLLKKIKITEMVTFIYK